MCFCVNFPIFYSIPFVEQLIGSFFNSETLLIFVFSPKFSVLKVSPQAKYFVDSSLFSGLTFAIDLLVDQRCAKLNLTRRMVTRYLYSGRFFILYISYATEFHFNDLATQTDSVVRKLETYDGIYSPEIWYAWLSEIRGSISLSVPKSCWGDWWLERIGKTGEHLPTYIVCYLAQL